MPLQIVNQNLITAYRLYRDLDLLNILRLDKVIIFVSGFIRVKNIFQLRIGRIALSGDDILLQIIMRFGCCSFV